jgi:hypothetical protein
LTGSGYPVVIGYERDAEGNPVLDETGNLKPGATGKVLRLSGVTDNVRGGFEEWLLADAKKDALMWRGQVTPEEFAAILAAVSAKKTAKAYSWLGPVWREVWGTEPAQRQMFYLLTRQNHPELLPDEVYKLTQAHLGDVADAVNEVMQAGNGDGQQRPVRCWREVVTTSITRRRARKSTAG